MQLKNIIENARAFLDAIKYGRLRITPEGILFTEEGVTVGGYFDTWLNGKDHQRSNNNVPTEALNYLLKTGITGVGGLTTWNIAPFDTNVTPGSTLTAATFAATCGEFINYDEATRQAYTVPTDPTAGSYDNSAALAAFTISTGVAAHSVYGAAILSASAKSATTGKILCASKFSSARVVNATDVLSVKYTIAATST